MKLENARYSPCSQLYSVCISFVMNEACILSVERRKNYIHSHNQRLHHDIYFYIYLYIYIDIYRMDVFWSKQKNSIFLVQWCTFLLVFFFFRPITENTLKRKAMKLWILWTYLNAAIINMIPAVWQESFYLPFKWRYFCDDTSHFLIKHTKYRTT